MPLQLSPQPPALSSFVETWCMRQKYARRRPLLMSSVLSAGLKLSVDCASPAGTTLLTLCSRGKAMSRTQDMSQTFSCGAAAWQSVRCKGVAGGAQNTYATIDTHLLCVAAAATAAAGGGDGVRAARRNAQCCHLAPTRRKCQRRNSISMWCGQCSQRCASLSIPKHQQWLLYALTCACVCDALCVSSMLRT